VKVSVAVPVEVSTDVGVNAKETSCGGDESPPVTWKLVGNPAATRAVVVTVALFETLSARFTRRTVQVPDGENCGSVNVVCQMPSSVVPEMRLGSPLVLPVPFGAPTSTPKPRTPERSSVRCNVKVSVAVPVEVSTDVGVNAKETSCGGDESPTAPATPARGNVAHNQPTISNAHTGPSWRKCRILIGSVSSR
jgi:hypothetical protein